jgi:hypothetical protein
LAAVVRSWADCQFFYQAELDHYLAHRDDYVREPQPASMPLITVLVRIGGQLLHTGVAWAGWTAGLALVGLLLGQREVRLVDILQIVAWSWLPFVVRGLAQCLYMGLTQDPMFNAGLSGLIWDNTPPPPGGGYTYVMPTSSQRFWAALLARLDVYLIWHLGLVVNGLRGVAGFKRSRALLATSIVALCLGFLGLLPAVFENTFRQFRLF